MASLEEAASVILNACMKLMKDESILIVTDKNKVKIAQVLFDEAQKITKNIPRLQRLKNIFGNLKRFRRYAKYGVAGGVAAGALSAYARYRGNRKKRRR